MMRSPPSQRKLAKEVAKERLGNIMDALIRREELEITGKFHSEEIVLPHSMCVIPFKNGRHFLQKSAGRVSFACTYSFGWALLQAV